MGKTREVIARMQRHDRGVFTGEMWLIFGGKVEVIAKHFIFEKSIY